MVHGTRREWTEILVISAVAYLLYQFNVFILFLVPVQLLYLRRGDRALAIGAATVLVATVTTAVFRLRLVEEASIRNAFLLLEVAIPGALLGGLVVTNVSWPIAPAMRRAVKLALVSAALGVVSIPVILGFSRSGEIGRLFMQQIEALRLGIEGSVATAGSDPSGLYGLADLLAQPERLSELATELLLRSYLFSFVAIVAASIWIGDFAAAKTLGIGHVTLGDFRLPERAVWAFLISWAGVLLDLVVGIGAVRFVAWNAALIMLLAFGVQGLGIMRYWLVSRGVSTWARGAFAVGLILMLFWPGANILIIILVPGLGVSETWIHYRKILKE